MAAGTTARRLVALVGVLVLIAAASAAVSGTAARTQPPKAYTLTLSEDRSRVDLRGRIDFGVTAELRALLEREPGIRTLRLQSPGGRIAEARGLVTVVWRYALATAARGDCASACTLVFVAGHSRRLDPGARLGFHGYDLRSPVFGLIDPAAEMRRDGVIFRVGGVDAAFLDRAMAVPHRTMWFPDRKALIAAGVIDRP
jgi:hypothetical protein